MPPVWSPDGETIFVMHTEASGGPPAMTVANVPADPRAPLTARGRLPYAQSWAVSGLAIMPDGTAMVQLEINGPARTARLHRIIFSTSGAANEAGAPLDLTANQDKSPQPDMRILSGDITWLYGSTFGVILHSDPQDAMKTIFYLYSLYGNRVQQVAYSEDAVNSAAWSPDGRWLIFSAESGLWGIDILAALQGQAGPIWISPQPLQDLDWK